MKLPFLISVPHAGLEVPAYLAENCLLSEEQIRRDGDEGAGEIFRFEDQVVGFVTTPIARAVLDMNRPEDDRRKDGVVKTHTCWDEPIYREPLKPEEIERLLQEHHRPYHEELRRGAGRVVLGVDCHTMAAHGPPVGPDPGRERPVACLGDGDGACPREWAEQLQAFMQRRFAAEVTINRPFRGGYITREHGREVPWIQVELSRAPFMTNEEKGRAVLESLREFAHALGPT